LTPSFDTKVCFLPILTPSFDTKEIFDSQTYTPKGYIGFILAHVYRVLSTLRKYAQRFFFGAHIGKFGDPPQKKKTLDLI